MMQQLGRWRRRFSGTIRAVYDQEEIESLIPFSVNVQKQRGASADVLSGSVWYYKDAVPYSSLASRIRLRLPLSQSELLRSKYSLFDSPTRLRLGRVLEDLDALAGDIAYKHVGRGPIIVTACMDRMQLFSSMNVKHDLQLEGAVTQIGRSSIRISMTVNEVNDGDSPLQLASSSFLMVSRLREKDVAEPVPKLVPSSPGEIIPAHIPRQKESENITWLPDETSLIHYLHRRLQSDPTKFIPQKHARDDKTILMHSQNRNLHGRMFGGYLMAQAYELAWLTACKLAKKLPSPKYIDDIEFIRAVDIGSVVSFEAQVSYTYGSDAIVDVRARVQNPFTGNSVITNTFHFAFDLGDECRQVVPDTYEEMFEYIQGLRRCQSFNHDGL